MTAPAPHARALDAAVRSADEDRWLASRFAPAEQRERLIALYAVNHEIAKTAESVSDRTVGAIRLAWWREAIAEIGAGKVRAHPAAEALAAAHRATALPLALFETILDARVRDFEPAPFASWMEQTAYIDATSGALMRLAVEACGGGASDVLIREAARAWGLCGLLRARRFWEARGRSPFPQEARDVAAAERLMRNTAIAAHGKARELSRRAGVTVFPALGYVTLTPRYLREGEAPTLFARQMRVLVASLRGRI